MTTAVDTINQQLAPTRIGQATAVEQSRAIAEVQAAIVVAQQCPRNITRAQRDMLRSCGQMALAEKAFFRYSRGEGQITGPSVQLARELARCFGNVQYGVAELRRDDVAGESEMLAFCWDVETNTRSSTTFIVPHRRDTKKGVRQLTDMRDIYENNANNGARRLREMIFAIVPGWYTEDAVAACYETLNADGGQGTLAERVALAIDGYATRKVTAAQLEQKLGAPAGRWTASDLTQLSVIYRSIQRGEIRVEDEFPESAARLTAEDITGPAQPGPAAPANGARTQQAPAAAPATEEPAEPVGAPKTSGQPAAKAAAHRLTAILDGLRLGSSEDVAALLNWLEPGYSGTRAQVSAVTSYLADHLGLADNDAEVACSRIWGQFKAAQNAMETPGDGPAGE